MHGMSINLSQRAQNQSISCNNSDGDMKQKKGPKKWAHKEQKNMKIFSGP
jgi:hypothetical protein